MVYSNQRFTTFPFVSRIALFVQRPHRNYFLAAKLALLLLFSLSTLASTTVPGSPFVGKLKALTLPQRVPLSAGVVLTTEILRTPSGPVLVHILSVDLTRPGVHLGVVQAHNRLIGPGETISKMANRTGALAGINGDYFEVNGSGRPIGMEVINGQMMQSPSMYAVFGITSYLRLTIAHETFRATIAAGAASFKLSAINHLVELHEGKLGLITPALGAPIAVRGDTVVMLQQSVNSPKGLTVLSVQRAGTVLPALVNRYALVGRGAAGAWLLTHLHKGVRVRVNEQISPDTNLFQALGGGLILIKNRAFYQDHAWPVLRSAYHRNPFTAVGISRDGKHALFVVFDGRNSGQFASKGVTAVQVASFLLAHGAYQAMMFDGGGSSEMVARFSGHRGVSVVNYPSEGGERPLANGLFVYA
ncbi:MAG TPA: phosphodiester glycosidase family protein [Ktedonobacteraceae bacterium]